MKQQHKFSIGYSLVVFFIIFILLGRFLTRRLGKGAGFLDVGKNKARIYAVDPSQKVTFIDRR